MRHGLRLALWGTETRYVARSYLIRIWIVAFAVSAAVLAIDLAGHFEQVMAASGPQALPSGPGRILTYLALRLAYNLPAILPLSVMIGIVWVEWSLARNLERTIIVNTGRSPLVSLAPALLVGLLVGALHYQALATIRPLAVAAQGAMGFRYYGPRFAPQGNETRWILLDGTVLQARIGFSGDTPQLENLRLFVLDPDLRLRAMIRAPRARIEAGRLIFETPQHWPAATTAPEAPPPDLRLDPVWLANIGLEPRLVAQPELAHLAQGGPGVPEAAFYRAIWLDRLAAVPRLVAMAVLMATLSLALMRPRMAMGPGITLAAAGYGVHVLLQILSTLGESTALAPVLAFWALPGAILAGCIGHSLWRERQVARALARRRA